MNSLRQLFQHVFFLLTSHPKLFDYASVMKVGLALAKEKGRNFITQSSKQKVYESQKNVFAAGIKVRLALSKRDSVSLQTEKKARLSGFMQCYNNANTLCVA